MFRTMRPDVLLRHPDSDESGFFCRHHCPDSSGRFCYVFYHPGLFVPED
jgi:hypothetical protein